MWAARQPTTRTDQFSGLQCEPPAPPRTVWNHLLRPNSLQGEQRMKGKIFLLLVAMLVLASPVFAQGTASERPAIIISSGLAMAIASGLCGLGQGRAVASAAEAIARNPGAGGAI